LLNDGCGVSLWGKDIVCIYGPDRQIINHLPKTFGEFVETYSFAKTVMGYCGGQLLARDPYSTQVLCHQCAVKMGLIW
jgi:hypothetical protein